MDNKHALLFLFNVRHGQFNSVKNEIKKQLHFYRICSMHPNLLFVLKLCFRHKVLFLDFFSFPRYLYNSMSYPMCMNVRVFSLYQFFITKCNSINRNIELLITSQSITLKSYTYSLYLLTVL